MLQHFEFGMRERCRGLQRIDPALGELKIHCFDDDNELVKWPTARPRRAHREADGADGADERDAMDTADEGGAANTMDKGDAMDTTDEVGHVDQLGAADNLTESSMM